MVDRIVTEMNSLQMQRCSGDGHLVMLLEMMRWIITQYFMQKAGGWVATSIR